MRIRRGNVCRNRHKKILKLAKGFKGARSRIFKVANIAVMKALKYAYRDRRATKRNMRRLWIVRINAAVREQGMSYSRFVNACKKANILVNRKMLADLAVNDKEAFALVVETAKAAFAVSTIIANASLSFTARSASIFLLTRMLAFLQALTNLE